MLVTCSGAPKTSRRCLIRFNDLFVERGWIMYDLINLEAAKQAIAAAASGAFDEADKILADTYTVDWIRFQLLRLGSSEAFEPRLRLAELALADYEAARYHASIPVVIALLDGFVHDVRGRDFFSSRDSDLTAFDSIAAHEAGLKALHVVLNKGRHKKCTDPITVPYRHGIVHGSDLAYDNRIVAAKTWAALFAVAEWGIRVERGQSNAPEPTPQKTLRDTIRDYIGQQREFARIKRKFEDWRPRSLLVGRDFPAWAPEDSYEKGSPERALVALLTFWKGRNYRGVVDFVTFRNEEPPNRLAAELRRMLDDIRLTSCALISVEDTAMLATKIVVRCEGQLVDARAFACDVEFKLMKVIRESTCWSEATLASGPFPSSTTVLGRFASRCPRTTTVAVTRARTREQRRSPSSYDAHQLDVTRPERGARDDTVAQAVLGRVDRRCGLSGHGDILPRGQSQPEILIAEPGRIEAALHVPDRSDVSGPAPNFHARRGSSSLGDSRASL